MAGLTYEMPTIGPSAVLGSRGSEQACEGYCHEAEPPRTGHRFHGKPWCILRPESGVFGHFIDQFECKKRTTVAHAAADADVAFYVRERPRSGQRDQDLV